MRLFIVLCFLLYHSMAFCNDENILIFVSFSMPKESMKGWMREGEIIQAPLFIRGLVNNSFKETGAQMMRLTDDNHGGLQLDPELFRAFDIKEVPAVVVVDHPSCVKPKNCPYTYDVVYGDIHLAYALEKMAAENDTLSPIVASRLKILRGSQHA